MRFNDTIISAVFFSLETNTTALFSRILYFFLYYSKPSSLFHVFLLLCRPFLVLRLMGLVHVFIRSLSFFSFFSYTDVTGKWSQKVISSYLCYVKSTVLLLSLILFLLLLLLLIYNTDDLKLNTKVNKCGKNHTLSWKKCRNVKVFSLSLKLSVLLFSPLFFFYIHLSLHVALFFLLSSLVFTNFTLAFTLWFIPTMPGLSYPE